MCVCIANSMIYCMYLRYKYAHIHTVHMCTPKCICLYVHVCACIWAYGILNTSTYIQYIQYMLYVQYTQIHTYTYNTHNTCNIYNTYKYIHIHVIHSIHSIDSIHTHTYIYMHMLMIHTHRYIIHVTYMLYIRIHNMIHIYTPHWDFDTGTV